MDDLVKFLTARLNEKERRALAARAHWDDEGELMEWNDLSDESFAQARSHDPERDLREVRAGRAILAMWQEPDTDKYHPTGEIVAQVAVSEAIGSVMRELATVDSDHPDYDPEWDPGF